MHRIIATAILG